MKNTRIGKVYIVTWSDGYEDYEIKDVFTTRKAAEAYIKEHAAGYRSLDLGRSRRQYGIEEWEVKE